MHHLLTHSCPSKPDCREIIKVAQSEMLQILQELYAKYDSKEGYSRYCGLEPHPDTNGQPIWCSLESWDNRENFGGWKTLK